MDHGRFETLAWLMGGDGTRRAAMRFLAGGALGGLAVRLGLAEDAAAQKAKRQRLADHQLHGAPKREGKGKRKGKGKKRGRKQDKNRCSGETLCPSLGCIGPDRCCPDSERTCGAGVCVPLGQCCPGENACPDGTCVAADVCCPDAVRPPCGACDVTACIQGEWRCRSSVPCEGGWPNPGTCQCECPPDSVLLANGATCCPRHRACGLNQAGLATICCDEWNICIANGQLCS